MRSSSVGTTSTVTFESSAEMRHTSSNPRASANALVDSGISVQYGVQANEQAIRQQLQGIAVYAAVTESPTAEPGLT